MRCGQCCGIERLFDKKMAARELKRYREKGPSKTTRLLLDGLRLRSIPGKSLLDIGGGVGAVQQELLKAGVSEATDADASTAYIDVAREEAMRQGNADRIRFLHGDFVDLAPDIQPADIVTLDRMICCYPDATTVLRLAAERARALLGLVYPRDTLLMKYSTPVMNAFFALQKNPFRLFMHRTKMVDSQLRGAGLKKCFERKTPIWQIVVYERIAALPF
jgi:magnesium-protoporphyrin O-methyltransferase